VDNPHKYVAINFKLEGASGSVRSDLSMSFLEMANRLTRELQGCHALEGVLQRLNYVRQITLGTLEQWERRLSAEPVTPRVIPEPTTAVRAAQLPLRHEVAESLERLVPRWADETTKVLSEEERKQVGEEVHIPQMVLIIEEYGDPVDNAQSETVVIAEDNPRLNPEDVDNQQVHPDSPTDEDDDENRFG
jgi:hypothetical protein